MRQHPGHEELWQDWLFPEDTAYEISRRQQFRPYRGADPWYQFELWDDQGFIGAYRIKQKVWRDNVRILITEGAARGPGSLASSA